MKWKPENEFFI